MRDRVTRLHATRLAAAILLLSFAVGAAVETPYALSQLSRDGANARKTPPALRALSSAFQTDIDRDYLVAAKANIPATGSYYIDQGNGVVSGNTASAPSVKPVTEFWLYPRRPLLAPRPGAWLICYGCNLTRWQSRLNVAWRKGPIVLGQLR